MAKCLTLKPMTNQNWTLWQKIVFRFFFIYFALYILTFSISDYGVGMFFLSKWQMAATDWMVYNFNDYILHFKEQLVPLNGSGDTSYAWVQLILYVTFSGIGTIVWSVADRKHTHYRKLDFILWNSVRYFLAFAAFTYGIIKVFKMQMNFPTLSQLATPLGDFLPMRFTWMYIGYSDGYQIFSGMMELVVFFLLLFRRTVLLGLFIGLGVFANVMLLNLFYDIPVKLFSIHLFVMCAFLISFDLKRIFNFFLFNKPTEVSVRYHFSSTRKWMRYTRIGLKSFFLLATMMGFIDTYRYSTETVIKPFAYGFYDIDSKIVNNDTVPILAKDSLAWKDMIFDVRSMISVNSTDTLLLQRYRRGYFYYSRDSINNTLDCYYYKGADSTYLFKMKYRLNPDGLQLRTKLADDSIIYNLKNNNRKFQLERREFHWLSESNR